MEKRTGTILVIEDDTVQRLRAHRIVTNLGHHCVVACDGAEALTAMDGVDVVLMDVHLPDFHGSELCAKLLAFDVTVGPPSVLAVSASDAAEDIRKCLEAGAVDYVVKPLAQLEIGMRIENALLRRECRRSEVERFEFQTRMETLSLYTRAVAHDIGTPLAALSMALDLLKEDGVASVYQTELVNDMMAAKDMIQMVTKKALDHKQSLSGANLVPTMASTDVRDLVAKCERLMKHYSMGRKDVKCHYTVAKDVSPFILSDATWLQDMIVNYLSNAHKFTQEGSISLSISVENIEDLRKRILLIQVKDTAYPGISPEQASKVFKPFVQLQTNAGGTGLGLASVASQTKALGGTLGVHAHSEPHGSVFWVRLPYIVANINPAGTPSPMPSAQLNNTIPNVKSVGTRQRSVLMIEDTGCIRKMARRVLEKLGLRVEEAEDGAVGLQMMKQNQFDLVLCDYMMPVMDGVACARLYREWASEHRVAYHQCICGLTATATEEVTKQWRKGGIDHVFAKPLPVKQIMSVLDGVASNCPLSAEEIKKISYDL